MKFSPRDVFQNDALIPDSTSFIRRRSGGAFNNSNAISLLTSNESKRQSISDERAPGVNGWPEFNAEEASGSALKPKMSWTSLKKCKERKRRVKLELGPNSDRQLSTSHFKKSR